MVKINKELMKGSTATLVLMVLSRKEMYGYELIKEIEKASNGAFSLKEGTLYPILHGLEEDKAVGSYWEEGDGSRKRKYYRITDKGRRLLEEKKQEWNVFRAAIEQILSVQMTAISKGRV